MTDSDSQTRRRDLRFAVVALRERGLYAAAKWAAEQLAGLLSPPPTTFRAPPLGRIATSVSHAPEALPESGAKSRQGGEASAQAQPMSDSPIEGSWPEGMRSSAAMPREVADGARWQETAEEVDALLLGKSFFDMREYRRAAHALRELKGHKAFFIRWYSIYLAGEKRKEEEMVEAGGLWAKADTLNLELPAIEQALRERRLEGGLDAFGEYLLGVVLRDRELAEEAREALCSSVTAFPWNWSAWQQLHVMGCRGDKNRGGQEDWKFGQTAHTIV
eukprot:TRINITY_DN5248_c0_g1_i2.p1 TRINITY_DN5248_c0_g1~~TRINITY_DN5248_c0_g1_i2.p1  ORF type:complete len:275 (-),score=63.24 TRINITY_DN5248_c0_g1_i2:291-1115(-)